MHPAFCGFVRVCYPVTLLQTNLFSSHISVFLAFFRILQPLKTTRFNLGSEILPENLASYSWRYMVRGYFIRSTACAGWQLS